MTQRTRDRIILALGAAAFILFCVFATSVLVEALTYFTERVATVVHRT